MKLHCGVRCPTRSAFLVPSALGRSFGLSCTPFRWSRGQKRQWFNLRGIWSFFIHLEIYSDLIMLWGVEDVDHVLCGVWEALDVTHHNVTNSSSHFPFKSQCIGGTFSRRYGQRRLQPWLSMLEVCNFSCNWCKSLNLWISWMLLVKELRSTPLLFTLWNSEWRN